jgi:hypothetical protein
MASATLRGMRAVGGLLLACSALVSCRTVVDGGVSYRSCRDHYLETFPPETTPKNLVERCWEIANDEPATDDVFPSDGDLVMRVHEPIPGAFGQRWAGAEQGPMAFQRVSGDFVAAVRVEALDQIAGDHCLEQIDDTGDGVGESAGMVVRLADHSWFVFLIAPFTPTGNPDNLQCDREDPALPTQGIVRSRDGTQARFIRGVNDAGIGIDGEAQIATCRRGDELFLFYIDPAATEPTWVPFDTAPAFEAVSGVVEVGATVSGGTDYKIEGHFTSTFFTDGLGPDGCQGALEGLDLPTE